MHVTHVHGHHHLLVRSVTPSRCICISHMHYSWQPAGSVCLSQHAERQLNAVVRIIITLCRIQLVMCNH